MVCSVDQNYTDTLNSRLLYSRFVIGFKITLKVIYQTFGGSKLHGYPEFKVIIFKVSGQIKLTNILPPFTHSKLCEMKS